MIKFVSSDVVLLLTVQTVDHKCSELLSTLNDIFFIIKRCFSIVLPRLAISETVHEREAGPIAISNL